MAIPPEDTSKTVPRKHPRRRFIFLGIAALVLLAVFLSLLFVGRWLVVEDPLKPAQAIVVLSGDMPVRAVEAAKLYRQGYAPKVWLTHSREPAAKLQAMGIYYIGEDFYDKRILLQAGVPPDAIEVLQPLILNTADEISATSSALDQGENKPVIIVTSKAHTRRTRMLWHRLAAGRGQAVVRAASGDSFDPRRWWKTTRDALQVVREILGILNVWAGLPLHPS